MFLRDMCISMEAHVARVPVDKRQHVLSTIVGQSPPGGSLVGCGVWVTSPGQEMFDNGGAKTSSACDLEERGSSKCSWIAGKLGTQLEKRMTDKPPLRDPLRKSVKKPAFDREMLEPGLREGVVNHSPAFDRVIGARQQDVVFECRAEMAGMPEQAKDGLDAAVMSPIDPLAGEDVMDMRRLRNFRREGGEIGLFVDVDEEMRPGGVQRADQPGKVFGLVVNE